MKKVLPESWGVQLNKKNRELFLNTVIKYLRTFSYNNNLNGEVTNNYDRVTDGYFGMKIINEKQTTPYFSHMLSNFGKETICLTLEEFINMVKEEEEFIKIMIEEENIKTLMSEINDSTVDIINNPTHYGGKDNVYEAIKVIEAWNLGFRLGNTVKYISRAGKKDKNKIIQDLEKARYYLDREISILKDSL